MGLVWFFVFAFALFLANSPSHGEVTHKTCSTELLQEDDHNLNKSGIHLTLHHVHGPCSPLASPLPLPFSDILAHDEARVRSLNSRLSAGDHQSDSIRIPLKPGTSIGSSNFYVNIALGIPAKYYAMIIDTGSSFSWLQCQPCAVYCHPQSGPTFNPSASKTYKLMSCDTPECRGLEAATLNPSTCTRSNVCLYRSSYSDGSYSEGYLSKDTLTIAPSRTLPGFIYGCGKENEGLFGQSAGIIGLSRNKFSMVAQLSPKYGYVFSYCLPTPASSGTLSIGRLSYYPSLYKFTPLFKDRREPSLYFLRLIGITVAGRQLSVSAAQYRTSTIIDSGTIITRLPTTVYTALKDAFVKAMSKYMRAPPYSILDTCFKGSVEGMSIPPVSLIFQGGAELKLRAKNVVVAVSNGITCLAFADNSETNDMTIIGNYQQQTFSVAYDVTNSRIGFAAGGCR